MFTRALVVAALLLTGSVRVAVAAEEPEHQSKNARKIVVMLASMGISHPDVVGLVQTVDNHMDKGGLRIAEERFGDNTAILRYRPQNGLGLKNMELKFTPDNSNFEITAHTNSVRINYGFKF